MNIEYGVAVVVSQDGTTSLILASENGHAAVVSLLIDHGADVNAKNKVSTGMLCVVCPVVRVVRVLARCEY